MKIMNYIRENSSVRILAVVITASVLILFYGIWTELRFGKIEIYIPKGGTSILLDEKKVGITSTDGQIITLNRVRPGEHSILVYLQEYYPWKKRLTVNTGKSTKVRAFFVREKYTISHKKDGLSKDDTKKVALLFETNIDKKISLAGDGNVEVKKEGGKIFASWVGGNTTQSPSYFCNEAKCNETVVVFESVDGAIDTFDFYPDREDVILFSIKNGVYAIEIDKRGTQNFQPLYLNNNTSFRVDDEGHIFIKEGERFFELLL